MIRQALSLSVMPMLITLSSWSQSLQLIDIGVYDALDFCNMSGCVQFVLGPTHIADNRLIF